MPKQHVTKEKVFLAASAIAVTNVMPTITKIREQLKGQGSETTIHRYLLDWKKQYLLLAASPNSFNASINNNDLITENKELQIKLAKQQEKNKILANELAKTEKLKLELSAKSAILEAENTKLKDLNINLAQAKDKFQSLYQEISQERELAIKNILADKNALITSLRQELAVINAASIKQIQEISFGINDSLIQEKVKAINLQDKIGTLSKRVQELALELQTAKRKPYE